MKNLLIILYCVIQSLPATSQKCHFTIDKKDAFTNEKINPINRINSGWTWISSKKGNKYFIDMNFLVAGQNQKPMTTKDSVMIKLENGTILNLRPVVDVLAVDGAVSTTTEGATGTYARTSHAVTNTTSVSSFNPSFEVDRSIYEKLSTSLITIIRYSFTGKPMDFDLTRKPLSKIAPDIMSDAKCILSLN